MTTLEKINTSWQNRSEGKRLFRLLGSCCYLGYIKKYPKTFGSLPGIVFFLLSKDLNLWLQAVIILFFTLFATAIASKMEEIEDTKNPVEVVIDGSVGMWISLFGLWDVNLSMIASAFILFRLLDSLKPFPISIFQTFKGGIGIVADDIAAGMVVNIIIRFLLLKAVF